MGENPGKAGRAQRWSMLGGSELWVRPDTIHNMNVVYSYVRDETDRLRREAGSRYPEFSFLRISLDTGVPRESVSYAAMILSLQLDPVLHIKARHYVTKKKNVKLAHKVSLIRRAKFDVVEEQSESG
jgi:hypothetical protein